MTPLAQAVYVTTGGDNVFFRMALISAVSLSLVHPELKVVFLTDDAGPLEGVVRSATGVPIELREVELPEGLSATARSRYLKTSMGRLVEGSHVYLDSDTLIAAPFAADLAKCGRPVAGVLNRHRGTPAHVRTKWAVELGRKMGWPAFTGPFLNGGVLYFDGSERAREFSARWHALWVEQLERTGEERDQASLNRTVQEMAGRVAVLPIAFNAFVGAAPCFARGARVWHYFTTEGRPVEGTLMWRLVEGFEGSGRVDPEMLAQAIRKARMVFDPADFRGVEGDFPAFRYYRWSMEAARRLDGEAMKRLAVEYTRLRWWSPLTLILWPLLAALFAASRLGIGRR